MHYYLSIIGKVARKLFEVHGAVLYMEEEVEVALQDDYRDCCNEMWIRAQIF